MLVNRYHYSCVEREDLCLPCRDWSVSDSRADVGGSPSIIQQVRCVSELALAAAQNVTPR